jgi:coproporphyrinogen III oxidase-like Fe-S oxidoreductase
MLEFKEIGINRISLGVQVIEDESSITNWLMYH